MTRKEAIARIIDHKIVHKMNEPRAVYISEALDMAIKALEQKPTLERLRTEIERATIEMDYDTAQEALAVIDKYAEQEPCDDAISRQAVDEIKELMTDINGDTVYVARMSDIRKLPSVRPQEQKGHCKECKYFEYDSVAKVDGVPLIVAHEICNKWGDGCKTSEDGYCFLFEPKAESKEQTECN